MLFSSSLNRGSATRFTRAYTYFGYYPVGPHAVAVARYAALASAYSFARLSLAAVLIAFHRATFFSSIHAVAAAIGIVRASSGIILHAAADASAILIPVAHAFADRAIVARIRTSMAMTSFSRAISNAAADFQADTAAAAAAGAIFAFAAAQAAVAATDALALAAAVRADAVISVARRRLLDASADAVLIAVASSTAPAVAVEGSALIISIFIALATSPLSFRSIAAAGAIRRDILIAPVAARRRFFADDLSVALARAFVHVQPPP